MTTQRPNILYIHSHDTGRYIQPYGHAIPTPHMQALAEQGVLFRQMFCGGPTCSPSRAALLSGQSAHATGMIGLAHRGFSRSDPEQHIVSVLRQAGYRTVLAGVQHDDLGFSEDDAVGFDEQLGQHPQPGGNTAELAARYLQKAPQEPFFLSVGFFDTHRVFRPAGALEDARYCRPPDPLPDTPETRQDMADFKASARMYDCGVGHVLDTLEATGLAENTIVVCTTDHGIAFPAMKCNLTDHGIGVMCIMRGPGVPVGVACDAMLSQIDILPTLCEMTDIEQPDWVTGRSMMPVLSGEAEEINEAIFAEVTYHAAYEPQRGVRTPRWKYIRRFEERSQTVLPNCDPSPSRDLWLAHDWHDRAPAMEQLYDLMFDPNEACNVAADPQWAGVLDDMRARLDTWMQETHDPLLDGPVPPPSGAHYNDPDGLSAGEPCIVAP